MTVIWCVYLLFLLGAVRRSDLLYLLFCVSNFCVCSPSCLVGSHFVLIHLCCTCIRVCARVCGIWFVSRDKHLTQYDTHTCSYTYLITCSCMCHACKYILNIHAHVFDSTPVFLWLSNILLWLVHFLTYMLSFMLHMFVVFHVRVYINAPVLVTVVGFFFFFEWLVVHDIGVR